MIEFISKNGHKLKVYEENLAYLREWCDICNPRTFDSCLNTDLCAYEGCATCPFCLNYRQEGHTQKEKMEAIQELFDTYYNRSIRGNIIVGMTKPILFKELEK